MDTLPTFLSVREKFGAPIQGDKKFGSLEDVAVVMLFRDVLMAIKFFHWLRKNALKTNVSFIDKANFQHDILKGTRSGLPGLGYNAIWPVQKPKILTHT